MIVAELQITASSGFLTAGFIHRVLYDRIDDAKTAYEYVVTLLDRRTGKANDLPRVIQLGSVNALTLPLDSIQSISLMDYEKQNNEERGMREAYPYLKL